MDADKFWKENSERGGDCVEFYLEDTNTVLHRLGVWDRDAEVGDSTSLYFGFMFHVLVDRIKELESRIDSLEREI